MPRCVPSESIVPSEMQARPLHLERASEPQHCDISNQTASHQKSATGTPMPRARWAQSLDSSFLGFGVSDSTVPDRPSISRARGGRQLQWA